MPKKSPVRKKRFLRIDSMILLVVNLKKICKILKSLDLPNKLLFFGTNALEINNKMKAKDKLTLEVSKNYYSTLSDNPLEKLPNFEIMSRVFK